MTPRKRRRLTRAGWRVGDAAEFLGLTPEEAVFVELKLGLADRMKALRVRRKLSQAAVARLLGSSQSRVAKMEAADGTVSVDLLIRSLLAIGATRADIARAIGRAGTRRAA